MKVIRVMSFNIWNTGEPEPWEDNPRAAWSKRSPLVVQTIHRYYPTLIGFQEFSPHHLETLRSQLPEYTACPDNSGVETGYEDGWDLNQVQMREEGSRIFLQQIDRVSQRSPGVPVILTGDFNCNVWDDPYRFFIEHSFVDTYRAAGHGDSLYSSTYHGYVGESYSGLEWGDEQCWRVDWILTRDGKQRLQTLASTILHDSQPPLYPSDHWPVITDLYMVQ